jgi:hypothetical protein
VLVANLADKANLAAGHIGPVLTLALLDLQKLVANAKGIELLAQLLGMPSVIGVRGVKAAYNYIAVTHG